MKVQEKDGEIVNIYAIYWMNNKSIALGFPRNYGGLRTFNLAEVDVIDNNLTGRFIYFDSGIYHWSLIEERLLDDLLELDEDAYKRFLEILKEEGQIEDDFY